MSRDSGAARIDAVIWVALAAMAAACGGLARASGFGIDPLHAAGPAIGVAALVGALVWGRVRDRPRLVAGARAFLQMTLFTILGVVLAYVLAARGGPLWDARLAAADVRLGFDWGAVLQAVDTAPVVLWVGAIAYHSLVLQMVLCIVVLSATGRHATLRRVVATAVSSGIVTILISGAIPAMGNLFDPAGYARIWPSVAWMERALIAGLRDGSLRVLDLRQLMGIVSFPSYHATLPLILAWGLRDVAGLRIAAPVWAGATILATPVFGGHYGVDVLAGVALGALAIATVPRLVEARAVAPARLLFRRAAPSRNLC